MAKLIVLGDSITQGWDGHQQVSNPIPTQLGKLAGFNDVTNLSVGGTAITGPKGLQTQVRQANFADYDYVMIAFGTNDYWQAQETIKDMRYGMQQAINQIKKQNSSITMLIVTPMQGWEIGATSLDTPNSAEVTQNQIDDMLMDVAHANGAKSYDWRPDPLVTDQNKAIMLGDQIVHPTQSTMDLMAQRYFRVFFNGQKISDSGDSDHHHVIIPTDPTDKPHHVDPIVLELVSSSSGLLGTCNGNFKKIFQTLADYSFDDDYSIEWEAKSFDKLNRAAYVYLVNSFKLVKRLVDGFLDEEDVYDDDLNEVSGSGIVVPDTLDIKVFIVIANDDFKKLQKILNQIQQSNV